MKSHDTPDADGRTDHAPARKPYQKPQLQVYGDLAEITKSNKGKKTNDGGGHPNQHFTS